MRKVFYLTTLEKVFEEYKNLGNLLKCKHTFGEYCAWLESRGWRII